ncbi:MAG: hypothetical protein EAZ09_08625 [Oscillatoriales cyanobacterium]|nr:MAG: hypothetical protein EAZ09_08625 [Oscillatoriales cyanobacterium]
MLFSLTGLTSPKKLVKNRQDACSTRIMGDVCLMLSNLPDNSYSGANVNKFKFARSTIGKLSKKMGLSHLIL